MELEGVAGASFAVWAPNARRVSVVGEFNRWDGRRHAYAQAPGGWGSGRSSSRASARAPYTSTRSSAPKGDLAAPEGRPLRLRAERLPGTASVVHDPSRYEWRRRGLDGRAGTAGTRSTPPCPSTRCTSVPGDANPTRAPYLTYRELADAAGRLRRRDGLHPRRVAARRPSTRSTAPGATSHGSLRPDRAGSARPTTSAPSSTRCTGPGIGVLLDWVPAHFPNDPHGLALLRRHPPLRARRPAPGRAPRLGHAGLQLRPHARSRNFLIANALFWLERYHIDGLRVDAVASMLYLRLLAQAGRVDPERARRPREPRGHRLPPRGSTSSSTASTPAP